MKRTMELHSDFLFKINHLFKNDVIITYNSIADALVNIENKIIAATQTPL